MGYSENEKKKVNTSQYILLFPECYSVMRENQLNATLRNHKQ